jgi:hypothetical protein
MAALETTIEARPDAVLCLVREFAERKRWRLLSASYDGTRLVFKRLWVLDLAAMNGQRVSVVVEAEDSEHSLVTVESVMLNAFGGASPLSWLDFGQNKRIVLGLLDFLTESTGRHY